MKGKTLSAITIALLALSMFAILPARAVTATMYIEPAHNDGGLDIDDTFTVTVMAKNFLDLFAWGVEITYDPAVVHCTAFRFGPTLAGDVFDVLAPTTMTLPMSGAIDNVAGKVSLTSVSLVGATGVDGVADVGYKLVEYDFKIVGYTSSPSPIHLNDPAVTTQLLDSDSKVIAATYVDADVETVAAPSPYGPTAAFTWTPTVPTNGTEVTFNAGASKAGFDGSHMCPITEYRWDFDGDGVFEHNVTTAITTHTFDTAGEYHVTLEVYAPGATPDTADITKTVKVIPPAMGAAVDLTAPTQAPFDGTGPDVECDAFAPQQLVVLRAKVTYNLDPVQGKLVAFEVHDGDDYIIIARTNTTNADGIAEVSFRIPSMPNFGDWLAIVTVDVAETTVADTMPFKVGWIIELLSVEPDASTYHKGELMYFTLTFKNIALTTKNTTLTVVVYDDVGVPIGLLVVPDFSVEAGFDGPYLTAGITVPPWTFIGTGKVYANAYTKLPSLGGVPYCPEVFAEFVLEH